MAHTVEKKKKKFRVTRKMAKYACFIISAAIMSLVLFFMANEVLITVKNNSLTTSQENSEALVHEYALISEYLFDGAQSDLKQFANSLPVRSGKTKKEVSDWLKRNAYTKAEYFDRIGFAFADGICVGDQVDFDASREAFFSEIMSRQISKKIVGPFPIPGENDYVIVLAQAVYDLTGNVKGVMSGTVRLSKLRQLTEKMQIKNEGRFFILGDEGRFVCHNFSDYLGKDYVPANSKYAMYTSAYFAYVRKGCYETIAQNGAHVKVYLEPIEGTEWTCGVVVPENQVLGTYVSLRGIIIRELFVALCVVFVLYLSSTLVMNNTSLWLSNYDPLTELWTRGKFEKEAQLLMDHNKGSQFVVMEIDLPGFKFINQGYGRETANNLLKNAAGEILDFTKFRKALCCRGYADHFYFLGMIKNVGEFMEDFEKMLEHVDENLTVNGSPVHLKYGITFVLPDNNFYSADRNLLELIGEASYAKSQIKNNLLQTYSIYSMQMKTKNEREQLIERQMETALAIGEFFVVYQPKMGLEDDKIKGAEALVRWNSSNSKLGFLSPADFIPVFERNGFIIKLDFAVYEMVFKFIRSQLDEGNPVVPVSVNMSRVHKNPEKFVAEFVERFKKYDIPANLIEIEILERASDDNAFNLVTVTERLHEYGFTVAMDDFGSGQSSLNMLSEVPIDVLKFDQNFLRKQSAKNNHSKMITTLLDLGKQLDKKTLFEGVETQEQRDMLRELKCDQVQGYFYSKPLPEKEFIEFVKEHI